MASRHVPLAFLTNTTLRICITHAGDIRGVSPHIPEAQRPGQSGAHSMYTSCVLYAYCAYDACDAFKAYRHYEVFDPPTAPKQPIGGA